MRAVAEQLLTSHSALLGQVRAGERCRAWLQVATDRWQLEVLLERAVTQQQQVQGPGGWSPPARWTAG